MNLGKEKGCRERPSISLAVNLTRNMPHLIGEAGVLLLGKKETTNIRISRQPKRDTRRLSEEERHGARDTARGES